MKTYNFLILTDHTNHSGENSVYAIAKALRKNSIANKVDIATRGIEENRSFFNHLNTDSVCAREVTEKFNFSEGGLLFREGLHEVNLRDYDFIWLRLPPPLDRTFLDYITIKFPNQFIANSPLGIYETGSKAFLMNFQSVCPPMKICKSIEDIIQFKNEFPIVLKPFREYGGKGIVRIEGEKVWDRNRQLSFAELIANLEKTKIEYLGVKFLKNVSKGDKRIIVVDGKVLGASLRIPSPNSWVCNVSMGGTSQLTNIDTEEHEIIKTIHPVLSKMGVVFYGVDTLVDDNNKRVLSEINTTSIGGLAQIAQQRNLPLVEEAVQLTINYFLKNKNNAK